jgi:ATP-dependent Clp protease ATP-binding subunit ClpA
MFTKRNPFQKFRIWRRNLGDTFTEEETIDKCTTDITRVARSGKLDTVFGRDDEIKRYKKEK